MSDFITKQLDTRNALKAILKEDGTAIDLTNCTVNFILKRGSSTIIDRTVTINDAASGEVWVVFSKDELDNPGRWQGEFVVTFDDGSKETFPNQGYLEVKIKDNIGE